MNIVIIGAGDIGLHLASIFSKVEYGVTLIDNNSDKLERASRDLDVAIKHGSATDWELLEELLELSPDFLIALTRNDEINLASCHIAKNLGYPQTIARVRSIKYLNTTRLNFERLFSTDHFISPEKLTADSIANMILIPGSIAIENFANGAVELRTIKIPPKWKKGGIPLKNRSALELPRQSMIGLVRRPGKRGEKPREWTKETILFPHGDDTIEVDDEVTFIGETDEIRKLHKMIGLHPKTPKSVVIVGGSLIGIYLAKTLLENNIRVRIIEKDFAKCTMLTEMLPHATVLLHDGTDYRLLQSERVGSTDVFVACTRNDEVNFLSACVAKDLGCENTIISLSDISYCPLVQNLGIKHAASPRLNATNRILSISREKTIASMVSMYNSQAEIMEVKVSMDSKIAGIPIHELGPQLPLDFLIVVIQSRGRVFIADGTRVLTPGDTVIVISHPKHINEIKKLF
ncbi:MAG: Trk system potassium transporter TrkA [Chlamydiia bacterium]|nr:Trk system potassium transporter TrkA [Chlamydiia bacterium]